MFLKNVKLHGFHGNTLCDFKEWGVPSKKTHISAATHHITLNLISNFSLDMARLLDDKICKLSNLNIQEF